MGAGLRVRAAATVRAPGTCSDCEGTRGLQRIARCRRFRVVASSSRRGWQLCGGNIWCGSVATSRWQRFGRVLLVAASSSLPRRRRSVVGSSSLWSGRRVVVLYTAILTHPLGSGVRGSNEAWALQRGWGTWACRDCEDTWGLQRGRDCVVAASSSPRRRFPPRRGSVATSRVRRRVVVAASSSSRRRIVVAASSSLHLVVA